MQNVSHLQIISEFHQHCNIKNTFLQYHYIINQFLMHLMH